MLLYHVGAIYTKHDSDQIDHIFTTSRRPRRDEAGVFWHPVWWTFIMVSTGEREIKLNRREPDRAELCTCLNKHFHSNLTATTSKDRVWQLSEARTNWVRKNNKNYRYSDSGRLRPNCFFLSIDLTIAMRCGVGSAWIASFSKIAAQWKTRNGN